MPFPPISGRRLASAALALGSLTAIVLLSGGRPAPRAEAQTDAASVTYRAGWNLVAVPTGTDLTAAVGPAYALGPGELVGGRAAWVYFAQDTAITLGRSAAEFSRMLAPSDSYVLAGDPSATDAVGVAGAAVAMTYDPANGYRQVSELQPGQGAFLVSHTGGEITLGKAPTGALADQVRQVQQSITARPTDRGNIDQLGTVAAELVQARQYDQVQSAMDDLRAAAEDGLRRAGSGLLPPLSDVQRSSEIDVREAIARARDAASAGNLAQADAELAVAQKAARSAEADGVALAQNGPGMAYLALLPRQGAGQNLAGFGALLRSSFFATSLGQPPQDTFWSLASTVLARPPIVVPPPASVAPVSPSAASATPAPAGEDCSQGCAFRGDGTFSLASAQNIAQINGTFTVQISVTGGQVSGQGTWQAQETLNIPEANCAPIPYSGSVTVSGSLSGQTLHLSFSATGPQAVNVNCGVDLGSVSIPGAGFPSTMFYNPIDVAAKEGATGSANVNGQYPQVTGQMQITLHAAR